MPPSVTQPRPSPRQARLGGRAGRRPENAGGAPIRCGAASTVHAEAWIKLGMAETAGDDGDGASTAGADRGGHGYRPWCCAPVRVGLAAPAPGRATPGPHYYLALGGSDSVGFQPTAAIPHGAPTDEGYADDLVATERARWDDLAWCSWAAPARPP